MKLLAYLPRFREANRQLSVLEAHENWSRDEIQSHQLRQLNAIWQHAIRYVPYYRTLWELQDLPRQFDSLDEYSSSIPLLSKDEVSGNRLDFLSARAPRGSWHSTSGSTGMPLQVFRSHQDHLAMLRARYRFYASWDIDIFDRMAWLWGSQRNRSRGVSGLAMRLREQWEDRLRQRIRFPASQLGDDDLARYLDRICEFRPRGLYGYSRALQLLAAKAHNVGFQCDSLRTVFLTGEAAPIQVRSAVSCAFGAAATVEYGSVECGFIAGQMRDDTLRVRDDVVFVETLPRTDGFHDIVVSVLTNTSFPLLRYRIGDVTALPLAHGDRGFSILAEVVGRNDDLLRTQSGRFLHPACVDELFEFEFHAQVHRYRVHQDSQGQIAAMVEPKPMAGSCDTVNLARRLSELLDGCVVNVQIVAVIPQTAAGKHRLVTSDWRPSQIATPLLDAFPGSSTS